ncbi:MAG: universal stress protein [Candidatus Methanofastidiosa archaeon]|nr:universal stress protein [Candidatus Methanofastidiosa archaeon]
MLFKKIVVPISGSEASQRSAKRAIEIAAEFNAEVLAIHAINTFDIKKYADISHEDDFTIRQKMQGSGRKYLDYVNDLARCAGIPIRTFLKEGIPAEEIIELAKAENADLIVIGSVGGTELRKQIIGSTTDRVIRWASGIPVLVITFGN